MIQVTSSWRSPTTFPLKGHACFTILLKGHSPSELPGFKRTIFFVGKKTNHLPKHHQKQVDKNLPHILSPFYRWSSKIKEKTPRKEETNSTGKVSFSPSSAQASIPFCQCCNPVFSNQSPRPILVDVWNPGLSTKNQRLTPWRASKWWFGKCISFQIWLFWISMLDLRG